MRLDLRTAMLAVNDHSAFDDLSAHWPTLRETIANASDPVAIASAAVAQLVVDSDGLPPVLPPASSCEEAAPDATCSALGPANSAHRMQLCVACTAATENELKIATKIVRAFQRDAAEAAEQVP